MWLTKDEQLWSLCCKGDRKAFEVLYRRYYPLLYNYGRKMVDNDDFIKDCVQDYFVKLIRNAAHLSQDVPVKSYLIKGFRHKIYDAWEKQRTMVDLSACDFFVTDDFFQEKFSKDDMTDAQLKQLARDVGKLPQRQREILYLYFVNELSHEEIADILNINYQSSKNLLYRAISNLRKSFFL